MANKLYLISSAWRAVALIAFIFIGPVEAAGSPSELAAEDAFLKQITKKEYLVNLNPKPKQASGPKENGYKLVFVWASWCSFCDSARIYLERLQARLGSLPIEIVGISTEESKEKAEEYARLKNSALRLYYFQSTSRPTSPAGLKTYPAFAIIDSNGRLIAAYSGFNQERMGQLEKKIRWVLREEEG